jgi:hypothetical protein
MVRFLNYRGEERHLISMSFVGGSARSLKNLEEPSSACKLLKHGLDFWNITEGASVRHER